MATGGDWGRHGYAPSPIGEIQANLGGADPTGERWHGPTSGGADATSPSGASRCACSCLCAELPVSGPSWSRRRLPVAGPPLSMAQIWVKERERRNFGFPLTSDAKWVLALRSLLEGIFSLYTRHFRYA